MEANICHCDINEEIICIAMLFLLSSVDMPEHWNLFAEYLDFFHDGW